MIQVMEMSVSEGLPDIIQYTVLITKMFATRLDKLLDHVKAPFLSRSKICNDVMSHGHLTWLSPMRGGKTVDRVGVGQLSERGLWRTEMG